MSKKKQRPQSVSTVPLPWWRKPWTKFTLIPLSTIVAIWSLAYAYKTTGANELTKDIYQPLYADLVKVESLLKDVSITELPPDKILKELRQTGALQRIPSALKGRLDKEFKKATETHMAALAVHEIVIREMSSRIMKIRTEEVDRAWHQKTSGVLREMSMSKSEKGISDSVTLLRGETHESIGQSIDMRNPNKLSPAPVDQSL